jgi:hypothetical protein
MQPQSSGASCYDPARYLGHWRAKLCVKSAPSRRRTGDIIARRAGVRLNGLKIGDLVNEGRR